MQKQPVNSVRAHLLKQKAKARDNINATRDRLNQKGVTDHAEKRQTVGTWAHAVWSVTKMDINHYCRIERPGNSDPHL